MDTIVSTEATYRWIMSLKLRRESIGVVKQSGRPRLVIDKSIAVVKNAIKRDGKLTVNQTAKRVHMSLG